MSLLSFMNRRPAPQQAPKVASRLVLIEWKDDAGQKVWQRAHLDLDRARGLTAVVRQQPPPNSVAQVREQGSSYPVEIVSVRQVDDGFELRLEYLWEGRRRQQRVSVEGPATLETDGLAPIQVEVVNISSGGMQLFATQLVSEGSTVRICGQESEHLCLVRHCSQVSSGYHIGLQFFGENRREASYRQG